MKVFLVATLIAFSGMSLRAGQSSGPSSNTGGQTNADTANATAPSPGSSSDTPTDKSKTKTKKVWTNEEISGVGGDGAISVVGKAGGNLNTPSNNLAKNDSGSPAREKQVAAYRDRLRQLNISLENTEKKIAQLRNFKADNSGASGGINITQRYNMTPVEEQVQQLEEKKKQIQAQIGAVEERARKNGFEPGLLR
jgi:hypothetical protein